MDKVVSDAGFVWKSYVARFVALSVGDDVESGRVLTTKSDPVAYRWSVIDVPALEHVLGPRLWVSDEIIARWMTGDMPDELAVEEVHTAAEAVLRHVLAAGKHVSGRFFWNAL